MFAGFGATQYALVLANITSQSAVKALVFMLFKIVNKVLDAMETTFFFPMV